MSAPVVATQWEISARLASAVYEKDSQTVGIAPMLNLKNATVAL